MRPSRDRGTSFDATPENAQKKWAVRVVACLVFFLAPVVYGCVCLYTAVDPNLEDDLVHQNFENWQEDTAAAVGGDRIEEKKEKLNWDDQVHQNLENLQKDTGAAIAGDPREEKKEKKEEKQEEKRSDINGNGTLAAWDRRPITRSQGQSTHKCPPSETSSLRFAMCLAGQVRSMVCNEVVRHMHAALVLPFRCTAVLDIFAHISEDCITSESLNEKLAIIAGEIASIKSVRLWPGGGCDMQHCVCAGHYQSVKWGGCMQDIERQEKIARQSYDFVIRFRPDLEYIASLPLAHTWSSISKRTIWVRDGQTAGFKYLSQRVVRLEDLVHVGDMLAVGHRDLAYVFMSGATDLYNQCRPRLPPTGTKPAEKCPGPNGPNGRWGWPECILYLSVQQGRSKGILVGPLQFIMGLTIIDARDCGCDGDQKRNITTREMCKAGLVKNCKTIHRRKSLKSATGSEPPGLLKHKFLSTNLKPAFFPHE